MILLPCTRADAHPRESAAGKPFSYNCSRTVGLWQMARKPERKQEADVSDGTFYKLDDLARALCACGWFRQHHVNPFLIPANAPSASKRVFDVVLLVSVHAWKSQARRPICYPSKRNAAARALGHHLGGPCAGSTSRDFISGSPLTDSRDGPSSASMRYNVKQCRCTQHLAFA